MHAHKPSQTAGWVAGARTLAQLLPVEERLAHDPYGIVFMTGLAAKLAETLRAYPRLMARVPLSLGLQSFLWWMQLRTRTIDDVLAQFLEAGGRQVVLLGAGYDCRALRFSHRLDAVRWIEVDHPNTQGHKRAVFAREQLASSARYVAWNFEAQPLSALPARLAGEGLARDQRVLTIWEGVTMYLSDQAIADTFAAVHSFGAPGSWLVFNYVDKRVISRPRGDQRISQLLAKRVGEPQRFGWDPEALPTWLAGRGYRCLWDKTDLQLAQALLPPAASSAFAAANRHIALVETSAA